MTGSPQRIPPALRRWLRPRRLMVIAGLGALLVCALVIGSVLWVRGASRQHIYAMGTVPSRPVAIVFGAQVNGTTPSPVLAARLDRARQLYARGKVRAILVTGDNGEVNYNEVDPMRAWLIERGVPARQVVGDYAGFDTYSSCVRAVKIFGVTEAVLVTQAYHMPRAVALCRAVGIDAVGVSSGNGGVSGEMLREFVARDRLACVKAVGELVVRPDPKYLGRHETGIEVALTSP